jgi:alpha-tubulin suppressor-like RCC1 family protein
VTPSGVALAMAVSAMGCSFGMYAFDGRNRDGGTSDGATSDGATRDEGTTDSMPDMPIVRCDSGGISCGGRCVDEQHDRENCGQCGHACTIGCAAGACIEPMEIAAGGSTSCARLSDGTMRCWGGNSHGQVGDNTTTNQMRPMVVVGLRDVIQIGVGLSHACALTADRTVRCWGENGSGQVGDGTNTDRTAPVAVSGLRGVQQVGTGALYNCAVLQDHSAHCWGTGPLGNDTTSTTSRTPVEVTGLNSASQVALGQLHACAAVTVGSRVGARCWGVNRSGQLGDGTSADQLTPGPFATTSGSVAQIGASGSTTCALLSSRSLECWGYGVGSTPRGVPGVSSAADFSLGGASTTLCVRASDDSVRCGPLDSLALVSGLAPMSQVAIGDSHFCALGADHIVRCWGDNSVGQLGDGTLLSHDRAIPVVW